MSATDEPIVQTNDGAAHELIFAFYEEMLGFFEDSKAPEPLAFTAVTAANVAAAAISDMPEDEQEAALAKAVEMMTLSVRATRMHRAATHEGGNA